MQPGRIQRNFPCARVASIVIRSDVVLSYLREWKSDQYILLGHYDQYWEGPPHYRQYYYRIIPDPLTQEMEFYAGTADAYAVRPHQVERLKQDPPIRVSQASPSDIPISGTTCGGSRSMTRGPARPGHGHRCG